MGKTDMVERLLSEEEEERILKRDKANRIYPWSKQSAVNPMVVVKAKGSYLWDARGNRYFDIWSQFCFVNVGHQHPKVIEAIKKQAENICVINPGMANETTSTLASMLSECSPRGLNKVFFTLGGAEANEHAIRIARVFTGKFKILSRYRSYHGATLGALSASGDPRRFGAEPIPAGFVHIPDCYCYRCPFEKTYPECDMLCARHIETIIEMEGNVAAVLLEPIVGANGLLIPPVEYLRIVNEICKKHEVLLIADEVMTGFGRTGRWFGCEHYNVVPDLMTLAKGINSGYVPLGAVLFSEKVSDFFENRFLPSGLTYSGHPLACAAAIAAINVIKEEDLVHRSEKLGEILAIELTKLKEHHPSVGDVRNKGLFGCIELVSDRNSKKPLVRWNATGPETEPTNKLSKYLMSREILPRIRWSYFNIGPPLNTNEDDLLRVIKTIDKALEITDEYTK